MKNMERFAVVCAMQDEAELLVKELGLKETERFWKHFPVYEGEYNGKNILITVCGVGKVFAAMTCQKIIGQFAPDVIVNLGIAGGVAKGVMPGDICVSSDFVQYDYDLSPIGDPVGQIDELGIVKFPAESKISSLLLSLAKKHASGNVFCGTVGTGDRFVSSSDLATKLNTEFGAVCCEMEGGAMAQVCYMNGVGFCALRAVSDNANENAHMDFDTFRAKAVRESTNIMKAFFDRED